jgi:hypothetical protein
MDMLLQWKVVKEYPASPGGVQWHFPKLTLLSIRLQSTLFADLFADS